MKIIAFKKDGRSVVGAVDDDANVSVLDDIGQFWADPTKYARAGGQSVGALAQLEQVPAVPPTAKIVCVGLNYRLHAAESNTPIPQVPVIFSRWASTLSISGQPSPCIEEKFDWEGELGIVIGRRLFRASRDEATEGIFGYTAFNDLSCRSFQIETPQWTMGKNSPASGPMSQIVTRDEVGDPAEGLRLTTRVNGVVKQDSTTSDMIFTVQDIIIHVSRAIALEAGDLIITGTPSGVGFATGQYLKPGDVVEVEIERIGVVRTPIIEA